MEPLTKVRLHLVLTFALCIALAFGNITRVEFMLTLIYLEINRLNQNKTS